MADDLVKARWVGPFDAEIGPGIVLQPGDEHEVTPGDLLSAHWEPVGTNAKKLAKEQEEHQEQAVAELNAPPEPEPARDAPEETE